MVFCHLLLHLSDCRWAVPCSSELTQYGREGAPIVRYMAAIQDCPVIVLDGKVLLPWSTKTIAKVVEAFTVLSLHDQLGQLPMPCNSPTS